MSVEAAPAAMGMRRGGGRRLRHVALLAAGLSAAGFAARAETQVANEAAPNPNVTMKLIELLVQNHVLTKQQADALLAQANQEAASAPAPAALAPAPAPVAPGTIRVPYVPQVVRDQIKEQIKEEVVAQAKAERWANPNTLPEWTRRITLDGDIRIRGEHDGFGTGNAPHPDFNAINNSGGFDIAGNANAPFINTTEDRNRFRLRARLGLHAQIDEWVSAHFRIATGNDSSPVSTNQTLGSPGDFSKYNLWLDRAYFELTPYSGVKALLGRAPNPFMTTDLLFDDDLNFDGASVQAKQPIAERINGFIAAGIFPTFNTSFDFAVNRPNKFSSRDQWLAALQLGGDWKPVETTTFKAAAGYFDFLNIQGEFSDPCVAPAPTGCNTDKTRMPFSQKGNTLFPTRNFVTDPANPNAAQPQFFGLASKFGVLDVNGQVDYAGFAPIHVVFQGDYVRNLLFDRSRINRHAPVNNLKANGNSVDSGPNAFMAKLTVGHELSERWDWNLFTAYKYLQADSMPDAFTDSDFHLGGTNAKGYIVGGNLMVANGTFLTLRWLSAQEVSGPPLEINVLQLDMTAKF